MAHNISGIITSFPFDGDQLHTNLVGPFCFIPLSRRWEPAFQENALEPYDHLTTESRKLLKELSFKGQCAWIETDYFGGWGSQRGEAWEDGKRALGPLISYDGETPKTFDPPVTVTEDAINELLRFLGVFTHEGKDEFDTLRLGWYRSNRDFFS